MPASLNLNFGKEIRFSSVSYFAQLIGIDVVIFAGGISSSLEGEQMPVICPASRG